jgi:hypothetical protein
MSPTRVVLLAGSLWVCELFCPACGSPGRAIRPVIYAQDDLAALDMRSAPVILVVKITTANLTGDMRMVEKPPEVAGPMTPTIPLHLARIRADVLLTLRGSVRSSVEFYSWVWASGKHGGPRLFHPAPGSDHVIFLRQDGGYLHTVGDYPSYDLELSPNWVPALLSAWGSGHEGGTEPLERLVALRFRAEFEGLPASQPRERSKGGGAALEFPCYYVRDMPDLVRLVGPFFVATQLDDICRHSPTPSARFAACCLAGWEFPGRCEAYNVAQEATVEGVGGRAVARTLAAGAGALADCRAQSRGLVGDIRSGAVLRQGFYGWGPTPKHRRETIRVYASAMDPEVHLAACAVAATTPEAHDIPECSDLRTR